MNNIISYVLPNKLEQLMHKSRVFYLLFFIIIIAIIFICTYSCKF